MTVNKERVQLLVDALRSGKFPQAGGYLRYISSRGVTFYCCLGHTQPASVWNDDLGASFGDIADAFERTYIHEADPT